MKVVRLQSNNVMRLVAVDITPEGNLITIGGRNGAGKSSVLNSLAMALGGQEMVPVEPIRNGETEGKIVVELDDLIVTRRFYREQLVCDCAASPDEPANRKDVHSEQCASRKFAETKSTLTVTNKDGAKYPTPQAMLNKLLGKLTFDPLAFKDDPKQDETLRKLVGLDTSKFDDARKTAATARAMAKKSLEIKTAQLMALPFHKDAPAAEIPLTEVSEAMVAAENARTKADEADRQVETVRSRVKHFDSERQRCDQRVEDLQKQIATIMSEREHLENAFNDEAKRLDSVKLHAEKARAAVPDVSTLKKKLADVETTNIQVRANMKYHALASDVEKLAADVKREDTAVKLADEQKHAALAAVSYPVPGLGLTDTGVTFNGLPFSQAATSEQLRVSVAIGLALNPTLRVLLIRYGNALDDDSMALIAKQAEEANAQLWCEYVTKDASDVQVMIVDGEMAKASV